MERWTGSPAAARREIGHGKLTARLADARAARFAAMIVLWIVLAYHRSISTTVDPPGELLLSRCHSHRCDEITVTGWRWIKHSIVLDKC